MIASMARQIVEPCAAALESCAESMSAAGIGLVPVVGHVDRLKKMAWDLRAAAERGELPSSYTMVGAKEMVEATPAVIAAALERPDVRSVSHLLRRYGIEITKVESVIDFDIKLRAQACPLSDRLVLKSSLMRAGLVV
jgi:hypothetical protein